MTLTHFVAKFADPGPKNFGFNHLKGTAYTLRIEEATSFNLTELLQDRIMWKIPVSCYGLATFMPVLAVVDSKVINDGTYDYDDLELNIHNYGSMHGLFHTARRQDEPVNIYELTSTLDLFIKNITSDCVVLTKRTTKEDILKEIKSQLHCYNQRDFEQALRWLAKFRFENDSFSALKSIVESISNTSIRSMVSVDKFVIDQWTTQYMTKGSVRLIDCLPFTDIEIVSYFNEKSSVIFMDQRFFEAIAPTSITDIDSNTVIKLGKVEDDIPTSFMAVGVTGVPHTSSLKALCQINADHSLTKVDVKCINGMTVRPPNKKGNTVGKSMVGPFSTVQHLSKLATIDMDIGIALCHSVKNSICPDNEDDIPGRVLNIAGEKLDQVYQNIARKTLVSLTQSVKDIVLIPLSKEAENSDWTSTYVRSVKIKYTDMHQYVFRTFSDGLTSLTHGDIDTLERTIVNATVHENKNLRWEFVNKSNGPKLDQRKEEIAKKLAFIESFLSPLLQFQIKLALGFPELPRGYIIASNTLNRHTNYSATVSMALWDRPYMAKKSKDMVCLIPNVNCMPFIAMAKSVVGSFEELEKEARALIKTRFKDIETSQLDSVDVHFMRVLYQDVCKKYGKPVAILPLIKEKDKMPEPIMFRFNTTEGKVAFDMSCLGVYNIYSILTQSVLVSMIENDTFINTDIPKNQLIDSENRILSPLRDNIITELTIMKSIYG